jgi:hypothetical protein
MADDGLLGDLSLFTDRRRTQAEVDDIFDFPDSPLERSDVEVDSVAGRPSVEPSGRLSDSEFQQFKTTAKESDKIGWDPGSETNFARPDQLDTPKPQAVHERRSPLEQRLDEQREAQLTTDPEKYASAPGRYDYPFVDTTEGVDERLSKEEGLFNSRSPNFDALRDI